MDKPLGNSVRDSRDVDERIEYLVDFGEPGDSSELEMLLEFRTAGRESLPLSWDWGVLWVNENYFTEYARELAEDIAAISRDGGWPTTHIDWERAAEELKEDFVEIEIEDEQGGTTIWYGRE